MIDEGGTYPIREKDFGLLDPIRFAGEAKDLEGRIIRGEQVQSCVQQQKAIVARSHRHSVLQYSNRPVIATPESHPRSFPHWA
jgi:hypothetical protein